MCMHEYVYPHMFYICISKPQKQWHKKSEFNGILALVYVLSHSSFEKKQPVFELIQFSSITAKLNLV